jgi:hypothetical protein
MFKCGKKGACSSPISMVPCNGFSFNPSTLKSLKDTFGATTLVRVDLLRGNISTKYEVRLNYDNSFK